MMCQNMVPALSVSQHATLGRLGYPDSADNKKQVAAPQEKSVIETISITGRVRGDPSKKLNAYAGASTNTRKPTK